MEYRIKTRVLLDTHFNDNDFNELMWDAAKPLMIENIKSVFEKDRILSEYIDDTISFEFYPHWRLLLRFRFNCNDENEAEAESFLRSCLEDIRTPLADKGYHIWKINCKVEEANLEWLDKLEDMVFGQIR